MKFRFCGDLDCQDWVLAEIATISKISSIKAKQLASLIAQYLISQDELQNEKLEKLANDTKLELSDVKACVALVEFILVNAAKYNVMSETLSSELQQLGLPKEHSTSLCRVYEDNQSKIEETLRKSSLKLNKLVNHSWRVDYIYGSNYVQQVNEPIAHIKLQIKNAQTNKTESHVVSLSPAKLNLLIQELKDAKKIMDSIEIADAGKSTAETSA